MIKKLTLASTAKKKHILITTFVVAGAVAVGIGTGFGIGYAVYNRHKNEQIENKTVGFNDIVNGTVYNRDHILPFKILDVTNSGGGGRSEVVNTANSSARWYEDPSIDWLETHLHVLNYYNSFLQQSITLAQDFNVNINSIFANLVDSTLDPTPPPLPDTPLPTARVDLGSSFIYFNNVKWNTKDYELSTDFTVTVNFNVDGYTNEYNSWMNYRIENYSKDFPEYLKYVVNGNNTLTYEFNIQNSWLTGFGFGKSGRAAQRGMVGETELRKPTFLLMGDPSSWADSNINGVPFTVSPQSTLWFDDFLAPVFWDTDFENVQLFAENSDL